MNLNMNNIHQVVIWGHKLHSHTHSYIHNAFFIAFNHIGYKTLWLDNEDDITNIDFSNSFFITEGQVDEKIPILLNSFYVLHNCNMDKYRTIPKGNTLVIQVFSKDVIKNL